MERGGVFTLPLLVLNESDPFPCSGVVTGGVEYGNVVGAQIVHHDQVIARRVEWLPLLRQQLTVESVKRYFAHLVEGTVERFDLPGIHGMNFLLHQALGGGGTASLRSDPLAKSFAQMLLDMPVRVPAQLLPRTNTSAH